MSLGLALYANNLTHISVRSLARLIAAEGIKLKSLDISRNLLTRQASALVALKNLTESMSSARGFFLPNLYMYCCGFTSRHAYHLVLLLRQNIKTLIISENYLHECVSMLVAAARQAKCLDLRGTFVTDKELIQVGRILQSNTCLKQLSIGYDGLYDEPFQPMCLTPKAVCEFIKLITSRTSRSELSFLSIADCYMNAVDSNEQVQTALKKFSVHRCYPLEIVKFSVAHQAMTVGRNFFNQLKQLSISDSLLRGNN